MPVMEDRMQFVALDDVTALIRNEYLETPGLALTFWQAQRLWNLSDELCERALMALVATKFLMRTSTDRYARRAGSPSSDALEIFVRPRLDNPENLPAPAATR